MTMHVYEIGDTVQAVPDGEFFPRAGVITAVDWDIPDNPYPVSVSFHQTPSCPATSGSFSFGELTT